MKRRRTLILTLLAGTWLVIFFWQRAEHAHVTQRLREGLADRAQVMSASLDIMLRAMRQFGGAISDARLQIYLDELVNSRELLGVALVNRSLRVIAESGVKLEYEVPELAEVGALWGPDRVAFLHAVDLGISTFGDTPRPREAYLLPSPEEWLRQRGTNTSDRVEEDSRLAQTREDLNRDLNRLGVTNQPSRMEEKGGGSSSGRRSRRWPWRGFPMSDEHRAELQEKYGVHGAIFQLPTSEIAGAIEEDFWLRTIIVSFGFLAVIAAAAAGVNAGRSAEIQARFGRMREQNEHLAQMNLAAAGLAHETRNPLNLVRGMAQMITRDDTATETVRSRCADMIAEVDRVTGQLNEFINFSRPPDPHPTRVAVSELVADVLRPLSAELEDNGVEVDTRVGDMEVEADEKMLRQVIFNLLLNSVQAMREGGRIVVTTEPAEGGVVLEVADTGPGISPELRDKIFQPYFTTREKVGTGLGLAIVRQIVFAHGWDIEFRPNSPAGAIFRVTGMKPANTRTS